MDIKKLKLSAKESLRRNWSVVLGVALISLLLNGINAEMMGLAAIFIVAPLQVGVRWFYLDVYDRYQLEIVSIFDTFKYYLKIVGATFMVTLFIALWTLLLVVPGIIKACSYSQTIFLLKEDPDLGVFEAITKSREMMEGQKKDYALTVLSFAGWYVIPWICLTIAPMLFDTATWMGQTHFQLNYLDGTGGFSIWLSPFFITELPNLFAVNAIFSLIFLIYAAVIVFYVRPYYQTTIAGFYRELTQKQTRVSFIKNI